MIYDLIIVGAGMSGISVAHFFRDGKVLLLEKKNVAAEATGKMPDLSSPVSVNISGGL